MENRSFQVDGAEERIIKLSGNDLPGSAPDSSKGAPTDPDAPVSGIRFLGFTVLRPVAIRHCRVNTFLNDSEFIPFQSVFCNAKYRPGTLSQVVRAARRLRKFQK